jgi:tetratricopeptide (TPR) repeat protein
LKNVAASRHTEPAKLSKLVRGDLDWITMKALEKDRARRYESANGLARDIQRFLNDEPVEACPPSAVYRMRKFARKNRAALIAAGLVTLALIAGTAVSTWQAMVARKAEDAAQQAANSEIQQRQRAEENQRQALGSAAAEKAAKESAQQSEAETKAVLNFVENNILAAARPEGQDGGLGNNVTLRRAIEAALPFIEKNFANQPLVEARLRMTMGASFMHLGQLEMARQQFQRALDLNRAKLGPEHPATLWCMHAIANSLSGLGRHTDALKLHQETLALRRTKLGPSRPLRDARQHGQRGHDPRQPRPSCPRHRPIPRIAAVDENQDWRRSPRHAHDHEQYGGQFRCPRPARRVLQARQRGVGHPHDQIRSHSP